MFDKNPNEHRTAPRSIGASIRGSMYAGKGNLYNKLERNTDFGNINSSWIILLIYGTSAAPV